MDVFRRFGGLPRTGIHDRSDMMAQAGMTAKEAAMDTLTRGMVMDGQVLVMACETTQLVQQAAKRHDLWPTAAAALGRVLSVGCLMGSFLKDAGEKIEIQIKGGGPLGAIVVDGYSDSHVRGYVDNPHVYLKKPDDPHKLDVGAAVGTAGYLRVIRDLGLKEPFTGEVALQTGEIGEDFAYYYAVSEQTPSVVSVGVLVGTDLAIRAAGALIIQLMPGASEAAISHIEQLTKDVKPISAQLDQGHDPAAVIRTLFPDYQPLATARPRFECECSKQRFADVLVTLKRSELQDMIDKDGGCETVCHFCNAHYRFSADELRALLPAARD